MKLRIARKIVKAVGTPDERRYSNYQVDKAIRRVEKTREHKAVWAWWYSRMEALGPVGRAELLDRLGCPGDAFAILMESEGW